LEDGFGNVLSAWSVTSSWNVTAGTYRVLVRDGSPSGCDIPWPLITIADPVGVSIDRVNTVSPTCPGANDGKINIIATADTGRVIQYSTDGSACYTNNIFSVYAGEYTVYVRDRACPDDVVTESVRVDKLDANIIEITQIDSIECYGRKDGRIEIKMASWASQTGETRDIKVYYSETAADAYVEGKGTLIPESADSIYTIADMEAGTYYIWAVDTFDCVFDAGLDGIGDTLTAVITEEGPLTVSGKVTENASCYGNYDGVVTIKPGNGVPVMYGHANTLPAAMALTDDALTAWPDGADSVNIQVGKGTYYVLVKDNCGAKATKGPFPVDGFDPVTIADTAKSVTGIVCFDDTTGVIEVFPATGGTDPDSLVYTLQKLEGSVWTDIDNYIEISGTVFENLPAGTFKVMVTDLGGCNGTETGDIVVNGPDREVGFTLAASDINCFGAADGKVTITATGGTPPYQFKIGTAAWRDFPADSVKKTVIITEPGNYTAQVRDASECTADKKEFTIDEPDPITLEATAYKVTNTCAEVPNGRMDIVVNGGNTDTFTIYVPGVDTLVTDSLCAINNLAAGNYTVIAEEIGGNGCSRGIDVTVESGESLTLSATVLNAVQCFGGADGEVSVSVTGGVAPYEIQFGTELITVDTSDIPVVFNGLEAGIYHISAIDDNLCTSVETFTVGQPDSLTLKATWLSDISCISQGRFSVTAGGGFGRFKYYAALSELPGHILVPDPSSGDQWRTENTFSVSEPGTYIVWAYDTISGCVVGGEEDNLGNPVNEWRVKIAEPSIEVTVNAAVSGKPKCNGDLSAVITVPADSIVIVVDGDTLTSLNYFIQIGSAMTDSLSGLGAGTYVVKVTHESGCYGTDTVKITEPEELQVALFKSDGEFTCPGGVEGYIEAMATGGGDTLMYQLWQDGTLKTDYQEDNSFLMKIGHEYTVAVMDENGCIGTSEIMPLDTVKGVEFIVENVTCYSDTMASARITASGETGRLFFVDWKELEEDIMVSSGTAGPFAKDTVLNQVFTYDNTNVNDVHYEFTVRDDLGCTAADADTITFDKISNPLQLVNVREILGDCTTGVSFRIAGGTAPYAVFVDGTVALENVGFEVVTLNPGGGVHVLNVTDSHQCSLSEADTIQLGYSIQLDTILNIYTGDKAQYINSEAGMDTLLTGGVYMFYYDAGGCEAELTVTVNERPRVAPVLDTVSPTNTIADNHPTLVMTFESDVTFSQTGYLTITAVDSTEASVKVAITPGMFSGNTVTVDYVWPGDGGLDLNTTYVVHVDGGIVMGDGLVWDGLDDNYWTFTTGTDYATGINPGIEEAQDFQLYPNPFDDFIRIDNYDKLDRVVVTNIAGQRILDIENPAYEIPAGTLNPGIYVVTLISKGEVIKSERMIKSNHGK
jgi:hypothetical protein